jgi:hypothetical protein
VNFSIENPAIFALLFNAREDETPAESGRDDHAEKVLTTLMGSIRACQAEGILIPGDPRRLDRLRWDKGSSRPRSSQRPTIPDARQALARGQHRRPRSASAL